MKVSIVFDRLRIEEKMLEKAALALGHDAVRLDAKDTPLGTHDFIDTGGVFLERCVSYQRGLHFTACLEFLDARVVNSLKVASLCGDKLLVSLRLQKMGVPTPRTHFAFSSDSALHILEKHGYPKVIKPVVGSWGRGVMPLRDRDAADAVIEVRQVTDTPLDRIFYLQEIVDRPPRDIRVITVGDRPVAAMYRSAQGFRTNVATGGAPQACSHTGEIGEIAAAASEAAGGGILGIDMMEDAQKGILVHEINNTVEFRGISAVSGSDIPAQMVEYAVSCVRK